MRQRKLTNTASRLTRIFHRDCPRQPNLPGSSLLLENKDWVSPPTSRPLIFCCWLLNLGQKKKDSPRSHICALCRWKGYLVHFFKPCMGASLSCGKQSSKICQRWQRVV